MSTFIDKDILNKIRVHLESAYPNEACGFLLGTQHREERNITHLVEVENQSTENQRRRFQIDPLDYLKAERFATKEGLSLLGIYHSHPDHPATPSVHDLEFAQPYFSYFIHSITQGEMTDTKAYRLLEDQFIEEKFTVNPALQPLQQQPLTTDD
jgi:proteasome lid subunit RPN8/RPN11